MGRTKIRSIFQYSLIEHSSYAKFKPKLIILRHLFKMHMLPGNLCFYALHASRYICIMFHYNTATKFYCLNVVLEYLGCKHNLNHTK